MVSPKKRSVVVGRLRSGAKGKSDSPEDWVSGGSFQFAESPVIPRRDVNQRRVSYAGKVVKNKEVQNRRQSIILRRLETDLVVSSISPRKTRRQSMAVRISNQRKLLVSSPPLAKAAVKNKPMLPPKKPAPVKAQESVVSKSESKTVVGTLIKAENKTLTGTPVKSLTISLSPLKFYSSPQKQKVGGKFSPPRGISGGAKRKIETEDISSVKVEPSTKKSKVDASAESQSPRAPRGRPKKAAVSAKSSPATPGRSSISPKKTSNRSASSPAIRKKVSRSAIPLRAVKSRSSSASPDNAKGKTTTKSLEPLKDNKKVSPANKVKTPEPPKTNKTASPLKNKTPSPKKKLRSPSNKRRLTLSVKKELGPRITRNAAQQEKTPKSQTKAAKEAKPSSDKKLSPRKELTSPKASSPEKKRDTKTLKENSANVKSKTEEGLSRSKSSSDKKADTSKKPVTSGKKDEPSPIKKVTPVSTNKSQAATARKKSTPTPEKEKTSITKKSTTVMSKKTSPKASSTPASAKQKRLTRSAAKSTRKVSIVGKSPASVAPSFRKTPGSKKTTFKDDDLGSSPLLSARSQLVLIRSRSPLRGVQKTLKMKAKPYTPKPDSPPSNILKKNMKNKVSQQMKAVTQVEVHQLMNGEISKPVRITSSVTNSSSTSILQRNLTNSSNTSILQRKIKTPVSTITPRKPIGSVVLNGGDQEIRVLAATPVSASNLPPTPTSSRKLSESVVLTRRVTSQSISKTSCKRVLSPAAPRSSTPIEEDNSVLDSLNLGTVIKKMEKETNFTDDSLKKMEKETNFTDDSINTDTSASELENSLTDFKENKSPTQEKKGKWSCLLM